MSFKNLILLFIILGLTLASSSYNEEEEETFFEDEGNTKKFSRNPYQILGIAPWSSFKDIKKKYSKLLNKYSKDRDSDININELKEAYESLEEVYKKKGDPTKIDVITKWVNTLTKYYGIMMTIYGCIWLFYKIQIWLSGFIFWEVVGFLIVERFFPHYFDRMLSQYCCSFSLGLVLYKFSSLVNLILVLIGLRKKKSTDKVKPNKEENKEPTQEKQENIPPEATSN